MDTKLTKYHTHIQDRLEDIKAWVARGDKKCDIAERLGITTHTFNNYLKLYAPLREAMTEGEIGLIDDVERAIYRSAVGGVLKTTIRKQVIDRDGDIHDLVEEREEEVGGVYQAQAFFLKNRAPDRWKDFRSVSHDGTVKLRIELPEKPSDTLFVEHEDISQKNDPANFLENDDNNI